MGNFHPVRSTPNLDWNDPNLVRRSDGDGHADILITEDDALTWYPSLAEEGFGPPSACPKPRDEETGPAVVFADGTQSIYLADLSGDGLTDIVRIRNGEVCYWPNLGYGRFGAKVTMDNAPWFDTPDQFDHEAHSPGRHRRLRNDRHHLSGARRRRHLLQPVRQRLESSRSHLTSFPRVDDLSSVTALDLLGNGTACLVWSSPLPGNARRPMRYIDLMGGQKPHLLVRTVNNLGAETGVHYAPSTKFYLAGQADGKPWITRLPFPVHVVERVETYDWISRNRFVTRYAYHHGYYDGDRARVPRLRHGRAVGHRGARRAHAERRLSRRRPTSTRPRTCPPVLTKTWFHTGAYLEGGRISRHFEDEYYREGDASEASRD